jgi:hypothetical protein
MSIIASADEETPIGSEADAAGMMAAFTPLLIEAKDFLFTGEVEVIAGHLKATEPLADKVGGRIEQIDPLIGRETRVEGETEKAIFLIGKDRDGSGFEEFTGGFANFEFATEFIEKDTSVGSELEKQRLSHAGGEDFELITIIDWWFR